MTYWTTEEVRTPATFSRRKVKPSICVADAKPHIRTFLREALEELGFVACECAQIGELEGVLTQYLPDLLMVGFSDGGTTAGAMLEMLAAQNFDGKVLPIGPRDSRRVAAAREHGERLGIAMLPTLATPFGIERLRDSLALFRSAIDRRPPFLAYSRCDIDAAGLCKISSDSRNPLPAET